LVWLGCAALVASRKLGVLAGLFVIVGVVFRAFLPNITLKRDAPYRGGFGGLLFFPASVASPVFRDRRAP
jgi:hypothetical protein